jgi:hypothetical protein
MKKSLTGFLFCLALMLLCGESADGNTIKTLLIKFFGVFALALSAWLFKHFDLGSDKSLNKIMDE